jgi:predicted transcriptional regulator
MGLIRRSPPSEPKSIKGAALEIGEPVTKLYHHVDQLERAGLIEVVEETRRRSVIAFRLMNRYSTIVSSCPRKAGSRGAGLLAHFRPKSG